MNRTAGSASSGMAKQRPQLKRPRRRTQSERSALTREKVMQAVVNCIIQEGIAKTTAVRIARHAGVTWGAIVHQFGDKESVLLAVLERSFNNLSKSLADALAAGTQTPRERVALLIDEQWKRLMAPSFRAFLEIVFNRGRAGSDATTRARQEETIIAFNKRIWLDLFEEFGVDAESIEPVRTLVSSTLLGMALLSMVGPHKPHFARELAVLKENVLHLLKLDDAQSPARGK